MEIRMFRAKSMPQALDMVRQELGPEATVLHTREIHAGLLGRVFRGRRYEIAAACAASSLEADAPLNVATGTLAKSSRATGSCATADRFQAAYSATNALPSAATASPKPSSPLELPARTQGQRFEDGRTEGPSFGDASVADWKAASPASLMESGIDLSKPLNHAAHAHRSQPAETPHFGSPALFDAYVELVEADVDQELARELVERLRGESHVHWTKAGAVRARLARIVEQQFQVAGPLQIGAGQPRVVALVGPTGVGKTTTIAKLAANYRLRDNLRVGLITVDTYRIAAVDQLRTYAEIIDLPLLVAGTPREMRDAVAQMRDLDLVLMDTAGRSPRDEVKIRELRSLLAEARPDEVHLVLSAASSARSLLAAVEQFAPLGVTATLLTKLDEATSLGALLTLARQGRTPISYLTDGQNVPDDICIAEPHFLAESMLNPTRLPSATR